MSAESSFTPDLRRSNFRNWLSLAGAIIALGSFFAFLLLVALDVFAREGNPYLGILTYLVAPFFLFLGMAFIFGGWWLRRRQVRRAGPGGGPSLAIDLSLARHRRYLGLFVAGAIVFLFLTAFNSYKTYHFTESVVFCGQVCHTVMEPEFTTYQRGAHARVSCADCHIGSGAEWYVKAKISGTYQVYATLMDKYERPIKTPIRNLRPAQETCERCHWPEKFTGNLDRTYEHFLSDRDNQPYSVRLLMHVGGGQTGQGGPFGGIHWHMSVAHRVEYFATDEKRQQIPWVRISETAGGPARVYRTEDFKGDPPADAIRVMDCMDCHNRPAHVYKSANDAVEQALALGRISAKLPAIKRVAVDALTKDYGSTPEANAAIADILQAKYSTVAAADLAPTIETVRTIYAQNFFPLMKADWRVYPDNIGHKDWPGCFRCHDDKHRSEAGLLIKASDCTTCHTILAQGNAEEITRLVPSGLKFDHPGGEIPEGLICNDCHNGRNQ